MGFVVEAWFYNCVPKTVLELICSALASAGFSQVGMLTLQTISWNCVILDKHKVLVAFSSRTESHLVVTVQARVDWSEGYWAFEQVFIYLLNHRQKVQLAELLLATQNSEPCAFLTHSFYRRLFLPTIVNLDDNQVTYVGESSYWTKWGPELHFIAEDVFERTQVDVNSFARSLATDVVYLDGGALLDCGWTKEFAIPEHLSSS